MKESYQELLAHIAQRKEALKLQCADLLEDTNKLTLEIGCGHGHYLTAYAQAHPGELCMGIDLLHNRIEKANKKKERLGLRNLHFIKADAMEFLEVLPKEVVVDKLFLLFLDPWPKQRHHKNRIIQEKFLTEIAEKIPVGGKLCFRTDHEGFFDWSKRKIDQHALWTLDSTEAWPFERETVFQMRMGDYQSLIARRV